MAQQFVIGVDLGGTHMRAALASTDGRLHARDRTASGRDIEPAEMTRKLVDQCRSLMESAHGHGGGVAAVGMGVPGSIDRNAGLIMHSPNLPKLNNYALAETISKALQVPVHMENDANVFGLGEGWEGSGKGIRNWVGLTLGTGVGGCLLFDHKLWHGDDLGYAGEIGHMPVQPEGPVCACGKMGCLETLASGSALVRGVKEAWKSGRPMTPALQQAVKEEVLSPLEVFRAAQAGDELAVGLFTIMGRALGLALAGLFSALGIRTAIIGGGVSAALLGAARVALDALANRR
jgi:glucokinase